MNRNALDKRLQELGIYSAYYMRKELKPLAQLLDESARLNCVFTGVNGGCRKLCAVTDRELIVICSALGAGEARVISRSSVKSFDFDKKLLRSSVTVITEEDTLVFTGVQAGIKDLFLWAMSQPVSRQ